MINTVKIQKAVQACFVDIDATITDDGDVPQLGPGYPLDNALFGVLRDLMAQDGWDSAAADIAAIGDNPKDDFQVPRQVGVRHFFLVDRKRTEPIVHKDGACYVNSLERVGGLIVAAYDVAGSGN
jgi:hypothetical protein